MRYSSNHLWSPFSVTLESMVGYLVLNEMINLTLIIWNIEHYVRANIIANADYSPQILQGQDGTMKLDVIEVLHNLRRYFHDVRAFDGRGRTSIVNLFNATLQKCACPSAVSTSFLLYEISKTWVALKHSDTQPPRHLVLQVWNLCIDGPTTAL